MKKKFYASLTALVIVLGGILMLNVFNDKLLAAAPRDCDSNAIINCGAVNRAELKSKYNKNATGDLKRIYNHYGISASMVAEGAPLGEVHKDGRVTVNGKTVATGASSIGRKNIFSGSTKVNIGGQQYYQTPNSRAFRSETISAFVFLDKNGKFISAILTSCGNPVGGNPVPPPKPPQPPKPTPVYKCISLTAGKISRDTYSFKATAAATGGATITGYRYDFGDGNNKTSTADTITHTYTQPGEYMAKLTVDIKVGNQTKQVTAPTCQTKVTVKPEAAYACESLTSRLIKKEDRSYAFDLKYTATGGATLQTVDFDFGDGQGREGVTPAELGNVTHSYPQDGTFTATATLHFLTGEDNGTVKDDDCQATITISPEMCPENPSLPVDDERCAPPVPELPKTGPMDFISGSLGIGSLIAATTYWYSSRRGLLDAWLSR